MDSCLNSSSSADTPRQRNGNVTQDTNQLYTEEDFQKFYEETFCDPYDAIMSLTKGNEQLATSLVNDAYICLLHKIEGDESLTSLITAPRSSSIKWLRRAAINNLYNYRRGQSYVIEGKRIYADNISIDSLSNKQLEHIDKILYSRDNINNTEENRKSAEKLLCILEQHLSPQEWNCLLLRYEDRIRPKIIAELLGMDTQQVQDIIHNAARKARRLRRSYKQ